MRGKFIVFEGGEGAGKTTQIQQLHQWLETWLKTDEASKLLRTKDNFKGVKLTREPGGTQLGKQIRQLLLNPTQSSRTETSGADAPATDIASKTELLLYAADRAQHVEETLIPWLEAGYWVLCDRYTDSTVAYQGYGRQLDLTLIHQLNQIATSQLKSDLTLWLHVSTEVGLGRMQQRGQADRIEQAGASFHQRVCDGFAALAEPTDEGEPNPLSSGPTVKISGDRPIETVATDIQQVLRQKISDWFPSERI